jgi:DNA-binding MarR family transcriptional regulator
MSTRHIKAFFEANRRLVMESRDVPVAIALTFLGAAIWETPEDQAGESLTLEELAVKVGYSATTVSQHLRYLGAHYRVGKAGLGLVETHEYLHNRRRKVFRLTPKGRGLIRQLDLILRKAT